jgi:hypothetical protein
MENDALAVDNQSLQEIVLQEWNDIHDDNPPPRIIKHRGKHMRVFEHTQFPDLVIKLPRPAHAESMFKSLQNSQQVLKAHPEITRCKVPATKVIPLDKKHSLFVMEKIQGIIPPFQAQEVSEQAYERFAKDANLETTWRSFFQDAAEFICLIGYWDVSWANIILIENGFGFIDYEHLNPSPENITSGIYGLLNIAPSCFVDMIIQIFSKHGISSEKLCTRLSVNNLEEFKLKRQASLALRSKVRKWQKDHQIKNPADKIDIITRWHLSPIEKIIIEKFNTVVERQQEYYANSPIDQRILHWAPLGRAIHTKRSI